MFFPHSRYQRRRRTVGLWLTHDSSMRHSRQYSPTPRMPLPSLHYVIDLLLRHRVRASIDCTSYFYQIPIRSSALRQLLGVRIAAKRGKFLRGVLRALPMGASFAPTTAQAISQLILTEWRDRIGPLRVEATVWLDNFLFAADSTNRAAGGHRQLQEDGRRDQPGCETYRIRGRRHHNSLGATVSRRLRVGLPLWDSGVSFRCSDWASYSTRLWEADVRLFRSGASAVVPFSQRTRSCAIHHSGPRRKRQVVGRA